MINFSFGSENRSLLSEEVVVCPIVRRDRIEIDKLMNGMERLKEGCLQLDFFVCLFVFPPIQELGAPSKISKMFFIQRVVVKL